MYTPFLHIYYLSGFKNQNRFYCYHPKAACSDNRNNKYLYTNTSYNDKYEKNKWILISQEYQIKNTSKVDWNLNIDIFSQVEYSNKKKIGCVLRETRYISKTSDLHITQIYILCNNVYHCIATCLLFQLTHIIQSVYCLINIYRVNYGDNYTHIVIIS